ncbi:AMP-binding protein [Sphingomonas oligophenolica]|uniref:AMP-binding protein n=1 Tax=Sphingomonas oligophenolica TaxID=301154 RepID=A0ABU9YA56_9SPHN
MFDTIRHLSFYTILEEHVRSYPGKIAHAFGGQSTTFAQLLERVDRLIDALETSGVVAGDRILWLGQNSDRIMELLIAASQLDAMLCPSNWRQSKTELAAQIDDLEPKVIFWQNEEVGPEIRAGRELASFKGGRWLQHDGDGEDSYESFLASGRADRNDHREVDTRAGALIIYTAAFDGRPNGAVLSQNTILLENLVLAPTQRISNETVFLAVGPLFHLGTLMQCLTVFHLGGTNVFVRRSDAQSIAQSIHDHKCTRTWLVSKTMDEIIELNHDRRYDISSLRSIPYTEEWNRMVTVEPVETHVPGYGQTEVMGLAVLPQYGRHAIGIFGRPSPLCHMRIVDSEDRDVEPGQVGEIVFRGPIVMNGYWRRPELNAQRHRNGWHHTNDLGRREADGSLTFIGPKVQMIKSGVENIYPAEVEACIRRHPAVADCGIIGVPHPQWIQTVKAIVVLKPGSEATEKDIVEHCRAQIASYKKPSSVEFREDMPRLASGGVNYKLLDEIYGGGNYPGGETRTS